MAAMLLIAALQSRRVFSPRQNQFRWTAAKSQFPARNCHWKYRPIASPVTPLLPGAGASGAGKACLSEEVWDIFLRTDVDNLHGEKLLPGISIALYCCLVYLQKSQRLPVEDPHGMDVFREWNSRHLRLRPSLSIHLCSTP